MNHPNVRLYIQAFVLFDVHRHRVERTGDNVLTSLREFYLCPFFPFRLRTANRHGLVTRFDDLRSRACMDSQPRVEG